MVLNLGEGGGVAHEFEVALLTACANDFIVVHAEVELVVEPDFIHQIDHLNGEDILSQIVSVFEDCGYGVSAWLRVYPVDLQRNLF